MDKLPKVTIVFSFTRVIAIGFSFTRVTWVIAYTWARFFLGRVSYLPVYARTVDPFTPVPNPFLCKRKEIVSIWYPKGTNLLDPIDESFYMTLCILLSMSDTK